jgi:hypothetical protein
MNHPTIAFLLILFISSTVRANDFSGKICFGHNLAKPYIEHTDSLYLRIDGSQKLYFNKVREGPVLDDLDLDMDHVVSVYVDGELGVSWRLNFRQLKTGTVLIWRSAGSWRMEPIQASQCK